MVLHAALATAALKAACILDGLFSEYEQASAELWLLDAIR
jgi:hypothetical protein